MKKNLSLFVAVLILALGTFSGSANAQASCTTITSDSQYMACCPGTTPGSNPPACDNYLRGKSVDNSGGAFGSGAIRSDSQWTDYCRSITKVNNEQDFNECCSKRGETSYAACDEWQFRGGTPIQGTVPAGTVSTNPTFSNQPLIGGNPAVSPQSSSVALKECSAIKFKSLLDILVWVKCIITAVIIPLIFTLAFLFFLWNVIRFMNASDNTKKEEAKERMWWGIIALFVMVGVWGIIKILSNTLGLEPTVPLLQTEYLDPAKANKGK